MKLDNSQSVFLKEFKKASSDSDIDFLILTGAAGTGKTEIIKESKLPIIQTFSQTKPPQKAEL